MSHTCHAEGCSQPVPPKMFACLRHWRMVPKWLQVALWGVYQPGQERSKLVTPEYVAIQTRCRLAIAEREGLPTAALRAETARAFRALLEPECDDVRLPDDELIAGFDGAFIEALRGRP